MLSASKKSSRLNGRQVIYHAPNNCLSNKKQDMKNHLAWYKGNV